MRAPHPRARYDTPSNERLRNRGVGTSSSLIYCKLLLMTARHAGQIRHVALLLLLQPFIYTRRPADRFHKVTVIVDQCYLVIFLVVPTD